MAGLSLSGGCLCGAVGIELRDCAPEISACHCVTCRRWSGSAMFGFEVPKDRVTITGEVRTYASSPQAERAFCPTCGTQIWMRDLDGDYEFMPGLFDGLRDVPLDREIYVDHAFACVPLAGEHRRITRADYVAVNDVPEGTA